MGLTFTEDPGAFALSDVPPLNGHSAQARRETSFFFPSTNIRGILQLEPEIMRIICGYAGITEPNSVEKQDNKSACYHVMERLARDTGEAASVQTQRQRIFYLSSQSPWRSWAGMKRPYRNLASPDPKPGGIRLSKGGCSHLTTVHLSAIMSSMKKISLLFLVQMRIAASHSYPVLGWTVPLVLQRSLGKMYHSMTGSGLWAIQYRDAEKD